jgi:hypothetical protein
MDVERAKGALGVTGAFDTTCAFDAFFDEILLGATVALYKLRLGAVELLVLTLDILRAFIGTLSVIRSWDTVVVENPSAPLIEFKTLILYIVTISF